MYDVIALGELLVDFTGSGESVQGNPLFEANPGGAPCNVLAMLARLGRTTAFVGKVGNDLFGRLLDGALQEARIGDAGLVLDASAHTTLAFVRNALDGEREFSFYRDPGADELLRAEELPRPVLENTRIFHFGSLSLTREPVRAATRTAVDIARAAGAIVSFDPNLRPALWADPAKAREQMLWGCGVCDILKVAEEELAFLTGCEDVFEGAGALRRDFPKIKLLLITQGKDGSTALWQDLTVSRPTYLQIKAVDTTGAGDTFCGACLHHVLQYGLDGFDGERLAEMLSFANAAASLITAKKGALRSMPEPEAIWRLLAEGPQAGAAG